MCFKYLLNRKYTAFEYMKTNKFLSNSLLQFKMQPSTDLQNVAKIQNNIYKINFKFSITNVSSYFIHVFLQYLKQIERNYSCGHYKGMLVSQKTVLDNLYPGRRGFS